MNTTLQIDSYQYKCKGCYKLHTGPTRTLDFKCIKELVHDHGLERIYEAEVTFPCNCERPIHITFKAREYPESIFSYLGYQSADAEIIIEPKVREHMETLQY
jgi:hypothetical protein